MLNQDLVGTLQDKQQSFSLDPRLSSNWPRFQRFLEGKFASERMPANRPHYPMMHSTFQVIPIGTYLKAYADYTQNHVLPQG